MLNKTIAFFLLIFLSISGYHCQENPYGQGKIMYENFCQNCHGEQGKGLKGLVPPLANADYYKLNKAQIACIIKKGIEGEITVNGKVYDQPMAGMSFLTDFEIANIINYINHAWEQDLGYYSIDRVKVDLENCK